MPEFLANYSASKLEQAYRLKILGVASAIFSLALATIALTPEPVKVGKVPTITLDYNTPTMKGAVYRPNIGGQKDGLKVHFVVPEKYRKTEQILTYKSVNLDLQENSKSTLMEKWYHQVA